MDTHVCFRRAFSFVFAVLPLYCFLALLSAPCPTPSIPLPFPVPSLSMCVSSVQSQRPLSRFFSTSPFPCQAFFSVPLPFSPSACPCPLVFSYSVPACLRLLLAIFTLLLLVVILGLATLRTATNVSDANLAVLLMPAPADCEPRATGRILLRGGSQGRTWITKVVGATMSPMRHLLC